MQNETNTLVMNQSNNTLTATEIIRRGREKTVIAFYEALAKIEAKPEISRMDEINAKIYREFIAEHANWSEQFQD